MLTAAASADVDADYGALAEAIDGVEHADGGVQQMLDGSTHGSGTRAPDEVSLGDAIPNHDGGALVWAVVQNHDEDSWQSGWVGSDEVWPNVRKHQLDVACL